MNLKMLLEIASVMTTTIQMMLSMIILSQFQAVISLKSQMKEEKDEEETSS